MALLRFSMNKNLFVQQKGMITSLVSVVHPVYAWVSRNPATTSRYIGIAFLVVLLLIWISSLLSKISSPLRRIPLVNDDSSFSFCGIHFKEPLGPQILQFTNRYPNDGLLRFHGLLGAERILVTSAEGLHDVLQSRNYDFVKPVSTRRRLESLLGNGIILAEGDVHKIQRKKLTPAFSFRHIKDLYPIYWAKSIELVQRLSTESSFSQPYTQDEKLNGYTTIDFYDWAGRATLDIIGLATFGKDFGTLADPNSKLNTTYRKVFQPSAGRKTAYLLKILFPVWFAQLLTPRFHREIKQAVASIKSLCIECVEDAKAKNSKQDGTNEVNILSVALRSNLFETSELVDQLMTFLAAGHETTAVTLTWLIHLLCKHPKVQRKLREEIQNHIPGTITQASVDDYSDLDSMPYLNAVCNETMRFIPGIPLTFREAVRDTVILGHTIPAGSKVVLSPWAVNRSSSHWGPTANVFDPERWMGSSGEAKKGGAYDNFSFMTFTHGPRSCIGQGFAKAELKALVVAMVGSFDMQRLDQEDGGMEEPEMDHEVVVRPVGGMRIRIKRLDDT